MKKILILTITILFIILLLPFSSIASSNNNLLVESKASFENKDYSNKTDEQVFEEKLSSFLFSDKVKDMIKKQAFDAVVSSNSISASSSYFIENEGVLKQTNKLTYKNRVKYVKTINNQNLNKLQNLDLNYRTLASGDLDPEITYNFDGGTLTLTILLITADNINYTCFGIFYWETLPYHRNTDAFGLTKGENLTFSGNNASAIISTTYSAIHTTSSNITTTEYVNDTNYSFTDLEHSVDGHAVEFNLPNNYTNASSATESLSIVYSEMVGTISYDGSAAFENVLSANHFAAYAHKVKTITLTSIDFSISFPTSFSLGGLKIESTYLQGATYHTWIR